MTTTIRNAQSSDVDWITALLKEGAKQGHFGATVAVQAEAVVKHVLSHGAMTMLKARNGRQEIVNVQSRILVAESNGMPASFLLSIKHDADIELHLAGTQRAFRKQGCFKHLVAAELASHPAQTRFFGRCYAKSTWAMAALRNAGFELTKQGDPIELSLVSTTNHLPHLMASPERVPEESWYSRLKFWNK